MIDVFRLQIRQILAGQRRWLLLLTLCAPIALALVISVGAAPRNEQEREIVFASILFVFYAIGVSAMAALLYGTSILGSEIQNQTLTYLFTRARARSRIVVGKYFANVVLLACGTVASMSVSWALLVPGQGHIWFALAVAIILATFAYNATFTLLGSIFRRKTLLAGAIYAIVAELVPAVVPANVRELTIMYYTRCLALELSQIADDAPVELLRWIGDAPIGTSLAVLGGITIGALWIATQVTTRSEFALTDEP